MNQQWKRNESVLNDFPGELYTIEPNNKIPNNCKFQIIAIPNWH